jgi:hypothetical protein
MLFPPKTRRISKSLAKVQNRLTEKTDNKKLVAVL